MSSIFNFFLFHHYRDADGRTLAESNISTGDMTACRYNDKRAKKPMNLGAWRQYGQNHQAVAAWFTWSHEYCDYFADRLDIKLGSLRDMWFRALVLRWFVHYRLERNISYHISSALSSVYKISRGIHDLLTHASVRSCASRPVTTAYLRSLIEQMGLLITDRAVCPAPLEVIDDYLNRLQTTEGVGGNSNLQRASSPPDRTHLDVEDFLQYLDLMTRLQKWCELYVLNAGITPLQMGHLDLKEMSRALSNTRKNESGLDSFAYLYGQVSPLAYYSKFGGLSSIERDRVSRLYLIRSLSAETQTSGGCVAQYLSAFRCEYERWASHAPG